MLCVQPDVLRELLSNAAMVRAAAWSPASYRPCQRPAGESVTSTHRQPLPAVTAEWSARVAALLSVADTIDPAQPRVLSFTAEAARSFRAFRADLEPRLDEATGDLAGMYGWTAKLAGTVARLAGLVALASDAHAAQVDVEALTTALDLGDYFLGHARAAFGRASRETLAAESVLDRLARSGRPGRTLSTRDIDQAVRDRTSWHRDDDTRNALRRLEALGWVRQVPVTIGPKGGRPSEEWLVRPDLPQLLGDG